MQVWDCRKSECHFVIKWIGVQNLPQPERVQTSTLGDSLQKTYRTFGRSNANERYKNNVCSF